jgi:hypothetical protein
MPIMFLISTSRMTLIIADYSLPVDNSVDNYRSLWITLYIVKIRYGA